MPAPTLIQPTSVILASGGGRGITARCAVALAERYHCKFILLGRSALAQELPTWSAGKLTQAELKQAALADCRARGEKPTPSELDRMVSQVLHQREIETTLASIQQAGGEALYLSADINQPDGLAARLAEATHRFGPIRGILHGAGSLADKRIEKKTAVDFDSVFRPKVHGLETLLSLVSPQDLDFILLFSSVAAVYGNAGQADYAIANQVLDQSARWLRRRYPHCRVLSVDWGPWEGGMVTPALKQYFTAHDVPLIGYEQGARVLLDLLAAGPAAPAQVVVGAALPQASTGSRPGWRKAVSHRAVTLEENPFLKDHSLGGNPVLPATCAAAWLIHACEQALPGYRFYRLEDFKVLKGIVLDGSQATSYDLSLEMPNPLEDGIQVDAQVSSVHPTGKVFFHYSGKVLLAPSGHSIPLPADFARPQVDSSMASPGEVLYADGTLFHGPAFQGVAELIGTSPTGLDLRIHHPAVSRADQGRFRAQATNPFINDAIVQCLLIWSQRFQYAPCLPSRLESYEQYRPLAFDTDYFVHLDVRSHSDAAVVGDIHVVDAAGQPCLSIRGLEGTISAQLKRLMPAGERSA